MKHKAPWSVYRVVMLLLALVFFFIAVLGIYWSMVGMQTLYQKPIDSEDLSPIAGVGFAVGGAVLFVFGGLFASLFGLIYRRKFRLSDTRKAD